MKFAFPKNNKNESVTLSLSVVVINKVRLLAELNECGMTDIYRTLIEESLEDYEQINGKVGEKPLQPKFSAKRDLYEPGDNNRKEVNTEKIKMLYCQNANCKNKDKLLFDPSKMIQKEDFKFCSLECANSFNTMDIFK